MFNAIEFIEKKRDGLSHTAEEIKQFVTGVTDNSVADYQLSAWLMAAYLNGLSDDETVWLTEALAHSGEITEYPEEQRIIDKHSTGGVGDKTTIVLIPLVASCGAKISKLSGPGLGYTGGTVDKLESIPGMKMELTEEEFRGQVERIGCAISGHSKALAPTEGRFYRMRDVTGTVPSIPLITSSIVSKKLAGGASGYLFDVKTGSGAFMQTAEKAEELAKSLVSISHKLGKKCVSVITDMEQPLGEWVGNSMEVYEAIEVMSGRGPSDTRELCVTLGGSMLAMSGAAPSEEEGIKMCADSLDSGKALHKFAELTAAQGGDASVVSEPLKVLPQARRVFQIRSERDGAVSRLDAKLIGEALRALGGGRLKQDDEIDRSVAVRLPAKIGAKVAAGDTVIKVYYNTDEQLARAKSYLDGCWDVADAAENRKLILGFIN